MNNFPEHKLLLLDDIESFQKENITIESYIKEFNVNIEKTISLKEKLQKELIKINNIYEKINKEVTESYLIKHEKLYKEESELKSKLQNEVTKVKEQFENFLCKSNNYIKCGEKIKKGIKILEKENKEENNMIKKLSYITKINKTQKDIKILFQELMRNLKINYEKDKSSINYEEYFFNGIPKPKGIELYDITNNSVNLKWQIDDINILEMDKKEIKYIIEMRKQNKKFIKMYEGKENCYKIDNLKENRNYEFRICSIYNDLVGNWSEIKKIKTLEKNDESFILLESKKNNEFIKKLLEWSGFKKMKLLYRGTRDGDSSKNFHEKCDNKGPTITLCQHEKGYIFGGFSSNSWNSDSGYSSSPNSFLFSLTNIFETEAIKFPLKDNNSNHSVYNNISNGPTFGNGHDLNITDNFRKNYVQFYFHTYQDTLGKGTSVFTGNIKDNNLSGYKTCKIKEIEVFKLLK